MHTHGGFRCVCLGLRAGRLCGGFLSSCCLGPVQAGHEGCCRRGGKGGVRKGNHYGNIRKTFLKTRENLIVSIFPHCRRQTRSPLLEARKSQAQHVWQGAHGPILKLHVDNQTFAPTFSPSSSDSDPVSSAAADAADMAAGDFREGSKPGRKERRGKEREGGERERG